MNYSIFDKEEMVALVLFDMREGVYDKALEKTKYLLSQEEVPVEIFSIAGKLYASLGLFAKAKIHFENFLQYVPNALNEMFQLGMVRRDMGELNESILYWKEILKLEPNHTEALFYMGETYFWLDQIDDARDSLYKLLETAQDNSKYIAMADELLNRVNSN